MKYPLHTTTKKMRDILFDRGEFNLIEINVDDFFLPSVAIDEDNKELYYFDYEFMEKTLQQFDKGMTDFKHTEYFLTWGKKKEGCLIRIKQFWELYYSIKREGLREPVSVTVTGQKLDGSHRAAIMRHLGHKTIPAKEYRFTYKDIDIDFIKRTLEGREKIYGKNYYYIDYGEFSNYSGDIHRNYKENSYDRWEALQDLIKGYTIDLGCNEGFIAIQNAMNGNPTTGYEYECADGANLNKLIFEFLEQREINVFFHEQDITTIPKIECDTCLVLNVIYHVPRKKQVELLKKIKAKQIIFQCNLRKPESEFRGCTVEGVKELCELAGLKILRVMEWRDKPIVIAK